jgi:hypothetical protein
LRLVKNNPPQLVLVELVLTARVSAPHDAKNTQPEEEVAMATRMEGPMGTTPYAEHEAADRSVAQDYTERWRPHIEALLAFGTLWSWDEGAVLRPSRASGIEGPVLFRVLLTPISVRLIFDLLAREPSFKKMLAELTAERPDLKEAFAALGIDV